MTATAEQTNWHLVCQRSDLIPNSGVCTLVDGQQIAVFYMPEEETQLYAVGNWDPIGKANVISRGIIGDIDGKVVVASPLYKQHFDLITGECVEQEGVALSVFSTAFDGDDVVIEV